MVAQESNESFNKAYTGPRPDILNLIPERSQLILDVGCSDGTLGASIKAHWPGALVVGMELSEGMGAVARGRLDEVHIGDIEAPEALGKLGDRKFDVVIFADILEHLRDPWAMLQNIQPYLAKNAKVICSIPNVRHIDTIYNLVIRGEWPYRDRGIHDRTHLRFFTKKNIVGMFQGQAMGIEAMSTNYRLLERPHPINRYARRLAIPGIAPFLAFQYLIVASQSDTGKNSRPATLEVHPAMHEK